MDEPAILADEIARYHELGFRAFKIGWGPFGRRDDPKLDEAIVAIPRLALADLRRIGEICARAGLEMKTMPSVEQLIRGEGSLRYLRKVDLDELLRRAPLFLDYKRVADYVQDKRVMVTGAGGSIGSELCRQLTALGAGKQFAYRG